MGLAWVMLSPPQIASAAWAATFQQPGEIVYISRRCLRQGSFGAYQGNAGMVPERDSGGGTRGGGRTGMLSRFAVLAVALFVLSPAPGRSADHVHIAAAR